MTGFRKIVALALFILISAIIFADVLVKYRVDKTRCVGCRLCVEACPVDAIDIIGGKAVIDPDKCVGCGECSKVCPTGAISRVEIKTPDTVSSAEDAPKTGDTTSVEQESEPAGETTTVADTGGRRNRHRGGRNAVSAESSTTAAAPATTQTKTETKEESVAESTETQKTASYKIVSVVDQKKCVGCQLCVRACPEKAITMVNGKAVIDPEKCTNCGECIKVCPVKAISTTKYYGKNTDSDGK